MEFRKDWKDFFFWAGNVKWMFCVTTLDIFKYIMIKAELRSFQSISAFLAAFSP